MAAGLQSGCDQRWSQNQQGFRREAASAKLVPAEREGARPDHFASAARPADEVIE
jgi:hypothetical protein